jgi:hypothetical protein
MNDDDKITVSKIEVAQRQLDCAIELWFRDGDEVSVHTLAAAAYQLVHDLKERRGIADPLLYDSRMVKPQYRRQWINELKKSMNFFKHADRDPAEMLQFTPRKNIGYIMFAAAGLQMLGQPTSFPVHTITFWLVINEPHWIDDDYRKLFEDRLVDLQDFREIPKHEFFEVFMNVLAGRRTFVATGVAPLG